MAFADLRARQLEVLDAIYENEPNTIIVGSIGRAALLGMPIPPPLRTNQTVRDIDTFPTSELPEVSSEIYKPFPVERILRKWILRDESGEYYMSFPNDKGVNVGIPSNLVEPREHRTLEGVGIRTLSPEGQLLSELVRHRNIRAKDREAVSAVRTRVDSRQLEGVQHLLDEHKLQIEERHPNYLRAARFYDATAGRLSPNVETKIRGIAVPLVRSFFYRKKT